MPTIVTPRAGGWLPSNHDALKRWIDQKLKQIKDDPPEELDPVIQDFQKLIETYADLYMAFHLMFEQIPPKYEQDPTGQPQVRLHLNVFLTYSVVFSRSVTT
jgi:phosphatidylserine decarboxylase